MIILERFSIKHRSPQLWTQTNQSENDVNDKKVHWNIICNKIVKLLWLISSKGISYDDDIGTEMNINSTFAVTLART